MNLQASMSGDLLEWVAVADFVGGFPHGVKLIPSRNQDAEREFVNHLFQLLVEFIDWGHLALRPGLQPGCRIPRKQVRSRVLCVECLSPLLSCQSKHLQKLLAVIYSV